MFNVWNSKPYDRAFFKGPLIPHTKKGAPIPNQGFGSVNLLEGLKNSFLKLLLKNSLNKNNQNMLNYFYIFLTIFFNNRIKHILICWRNRLWLNQAESNRVQIYIIISKFLFAKTTFRKNSKYFSFNHKNLSNIIVKEKLF